MGEKGLYPFAGIIRIRFNGYDLRLLCGNHPRLNAFSPLSVFKGNGDVANLILRVNERGRKL